MGVTRSLWAMESLVGSTNSTGSPCAPSTMGAAASAGASTHDGNAGGDSGGAGADAEADAGDAGDAAHGLGGDVAGGGFGVTRGRHVERDANTPCRARPAAGAALPAPACGR
jgi:hypothetical protein